MALTAGMRTAPDSRLTFSRKGRDSGGVLESVRVALADAAVRGLGARCFLAQDRARHRIGRNVMQSFNALS
jgi:hypothetical protein